MSLFSTLLLAGSAASLSAADSNVSEKNPATTLPDLLVTGQSEPQTYAATNSVTALKSDVPLLKTPQAVSIVPRALMADQGARKLGDVLKNAAGVSIGGYYSDWDYYRIRGFDASFFAYLDGLLAPDGDNEELWGLERVEVIKGPASTLFGQGPLGGMVNMISKRPQPENFLDAQFTYGSYDFYEPAFDWNFALNESKTVYGRLNFLYRDNGSFVDFSGSERVFAAPALTWEISPTTTLTILTSYKNSWHNHGFPLPARGTVLPNINGKLPISLNIGGYGGLNDVNEWAATGGYELKHAFNEHLSLRQNLRVQHRASNWDDLMYPWGLDPDERTMTLGPYSAIGHENEFLVDTALDGKFETGSVEHTLTAGVDYRQNESVWISRSADPVTQDLYAPGYTAFPAFNYGDWTAVPEESHQIGFYVQEHATLFEKVTVVLGGRFDHATSDDEHANEFSPKAGLTYEFVPGLAAYANYSQSFKPQWFNTDADGNAVDPEKGENFEIGLKASMLDDRLYGLLALYHLTRQNVATDNPTTPQTGDSIVSGEQRSRGVELEGGFRPAPGWEFTAAYTYIDAEITKDNTLPVGSRLQGVPEHAFSVWAKYTLQSGPLKGLGVGLGGRYYTEQEGDATYTAGNAFKLPAYGIMDAAVYYRRGRFNAQVNVQNVLDERYYAGSYDQNYVLPGEPITARATVGWTF